MNLIKWTFRRWKSLRIPVKFGYAFGLLLLVIATQTIIAYTALSNVWGANLSIQSGVEVQRLSMGMSRNWEMARRLQAMFFVRSPSLEVEQAYKLYALPASVKIGEIVRDGAALRRLLTTNDNFQYLQGYDADVSKILSAISQYATTLEASVNLELRLTSPETGLLSRLAGISAQLLKIIQTYDQCSGLLSAYYEMRFYEKGYLATGDRELIAKVFESARQLRRNIENCPQQNDQQILALSYLTEYEALSEEVFDVDAQIRKGLEQLEGLGDSIDLNLVNLLVAADSEVKNANLQIEQIRRTAVVMLSADIVIGLLFTVTIAVLLHRSVTRNIINLTHVTSRFQGGDMGARAQTDSDDELGELASSFNTMAETLVRRLTQIEGLHAQLREQAIHDALTGLFNRRYLDEILSRELARASRDDTQITAAMMDIDNFKEINDLHGHAVGDRILAEFGRLLFSKSRGSDIACRYGGDEFVVVLLGIELEEGMRYMERMKSHFKEIKVSSNEMEVHSTISIGLVQWVEGETPADLLIRADKALYHAKSMGRNRISKGVWHRNTQERGKPNS
jgi:diguanylate cyclase (GGDEF)-like protein